MTPTATSTPGTTAARSFASLTQGYAEKMVYNTRPMRSTTRKLTFGMVVVVTGIPRWHRCSWTYQLKDEAWKPVKRAARDNTSMSSIASASVCSPAGA